MTIHQDIDKLFKKGLSDYSEKPPSFAWNNIEQNLNHKRIKRRRNIAYSAAASIAILLSFSVGYLLPDGKPKDQIALSQNEVTPTEIANVAGNSEKTITTNEDSDTENSNIEHISSKPIIQKNNQKPETQLKNINSTPSEKKIKKSNIKKVNSSGILLPPMFANAKEFEEPATNNFEDIENNNETNDASLNHLKMRNFSFAKLDNTRELNYDYRQITPIPDYSLSINDVKNTSPWSVGVSAAPLVSYRNIIDVPTEQASLAEISTNYDLNYTNEKPLVSYSAGVGVNYKVGNRWKIQSGFYISELGQISENVELNEIPNYAATNSESYAINTSTGNININGTPNELISRLNTSKDGNSDLMFAPQPPGNLNAEISDVGIQTNFVQTYEYYEVPVIVNYTVIDRKLSMSVSGGLSANILYGNNVYVQNDNNRYELDAESDDLENMNYSGILGIGLEYPIVSKLNFNFQPTLRYSLSPINGSGSVYPYSFGLYTGIQYNF